MQYKIVISPEAAADLQKLARNEPKAYEKAKRFIEELKEHPKTGLGLRHGSTCPRVLYPHAQGLSRV